jgi:hypothetical protein
MFEAIIKKAFARLLMPLLAIALAGCQSGGMASYVSPRVTGRVVAADTRQPLAGVKIQRVVPNQNSGAAGSPKGAQLLQSSGAVRSAGDGTFVLDSESTLSPFQHSSWYSVTISFQHPGYKIFETNYTIANITSHTTEGAPVVNAGDVMLPAAPR